MIQCVKIIIATHKQYDFPDVNYYIPIQVGSALSGNELDILDDNTGDNISIKNKSFCELTALYWAWKNCFLDNAMYVGLVHYRRYFAGSKIKLKEKGIMSADELLLLLKKYDCIVPKKRKYYIETIYEHYKNAHFAKDLDAVREVLFEKYPDYLDTFDDFMQHRELYLFNMFVMKKELFDSYCHWLFNILFTLEKRIDISNYDKYQTRVFGFIAERLFNVWLIKNHLKLCEIKIQNMEKENILMKAIGLLKRKFLKCR